MNVLILTLWVLGSLGRPAVGQAEGMAVPLLEALRMEPGLFEQLSSVLPENAGLPVGVQVFDGEGHPAPGTPLTLAWDGGERVLETSPAGRIGFDMRPWALKSATVAVGDSHRLKVEPFSAAVLRIDVNEEAFVDGPVRITEAADELPVVTEELRFGRLMVRAPSGRSEVLAEALAELGQMLGFIAAYGGFDPLSLEFGVDLSLRPGRGSGSRASGGALLIPLTLEEWLDRESVARWIVIHELAELHAVQLIPSATHGRLRSATDGIAELIAFEYCRTFAPGTAVQRLEGFLEEIPEAEIQLDLDDFRAPAGRDNPRAQRIGADRNGKLLYALTLLRWTAAERGRPGIVRHVIGEFAAGRLLRPSDLEGELMASAAKLPGRSMSTAEIALGIRALRGRVSNGR